MHIGILCPAVPGHLNPSMALAHELRNRGHRLTFYLPASVRAKIEAAGYGFRAYAEEEFPDNVYAESLATLARMSGIRAFRYTIDLFTKLGVACLREVPGMVRADRIDLMIVDESIYHGGSIADALGIPYVTLSNALLLLPEAHIPPFFTTWGYSRSVGARLRNRAMYHLLRYFVRGSMRLINDYRRKNKLRPFHRLVDARSDLAHLCQQVPEFDFPRKALSSSFHYVGPLHTQASRAPTEFPWNRLDGRPLFYASMGTLQNRQRAIFSAIAEACAEGEGQLVISLGGGSRPEDLGPLPGSPVVVEFAPQLELLKRAALCITHAGLNTTLEALACAVPLVAIPITNDQPGVAARIRHTGVGEFLPLGKLTAPALRGLLVKVLRSPSYKAAALQMQQSIHRHPGPRKAADVIERVAMPRPAALAG